MQKRAYSDDLFIAIEIFEGDVWCERNEVHRERFLHGSSHEICRKDV